MPVMPKQRGFTLIEIMIVTVIVAILAAVAIPSYRNYVTESRRSAVKSLLLDMAAKQENYFADLKKYTGDPEDLGYPASTFYIDSNGNPSASSSANSTYRITMSQTSGSSFDYTITAEAVNRQADDSQCATFELDNEGNRTATSGNCW